MDVTSDVVMAYLDCPYKAYLTMRGENGADSDYQFLLSGERDIERFAEELLGK